jgi:hypothetical protein
VASSSAWKKKTEAIFRKYWWIPAIGIAVFAAVDIGPSCSGGYAPTQLELLVLRLESSYKREIEFNEYSLHFMAEPPDRVTIRILYTPKANMRVLSTIAESAKDLVRKTAAESFKPLNVRVSVQMRPLSQGS